MKKPKTRKKFDLQVFLLLIAVFTAIVGVAMTTRRWTVFESIVNALVPVVGGSALGAWMVMMIDSYFEKRRKGQ